MMICITKNMNVVLSVMEGLSSFPRIVNVHCLVSKSNSPPSIVHKSSASIFSFMKFSLCFGMHGISGRRGAPVIDIVEHCPHFLYCHFRAGFGRDGDRPGAVHRGNKTMSEMLVFDLVYIEILEDAEPGRF